MTETPDPFPTHTAVGLAVPDWASASIPATDDEDFYGDETPRFAGVHVPRSSASGDRLVQLVCEQLAGLLAHLGLPDSSKVVLAAAEHEVADSKFSRDVITLDRRDALNSLDRAERFLDMRPSVEMITDAARSLYQAVTPGTDDESFVKLTPDIRVRWYAAARHCLDATVEWERTRASTASTRLSRNGQVERAEAERLSAIEWETTAPLPVERAFEDWTDVTYTGDDPSIARRFEQFSRRRARGNRKWSLVNLGNGEDAVDVPTRDLAAAPSPIAPPEATS